MSLLNSCLNQDSRLQFKAAICDNAMILIVLVLGLFFNINIYYTFYEGVWSINVRNLSSLWMKWTFSSNSHNCGWKLDQPGWALDQPELKMPWLCMRLTQPYLAMLELKLKLILAPVHLILAPSQTQAQAHIKKMLKCVCNWACAHACVRMGLSF